MYRRPTREEITIVKRAFNKWGIFSYLRDKPLLIKERKIDKQKEIYLLTSDLEQVVIDRIPCFAGLKIGELTKKFTPSLQGADLIARTSNKFPYILVNEISEQRVVYGKNILGESIIEKSEMLDENQLVILLNKKRETIGIGRTRVSSRYLLQQGKATVTTLVDIGSYLRNE